MSNLNLKGIWIPIEILTDNKLRDKEKIIYTIIIYLSKEKRYCYLTNKSISELLNISITQVSKLVNSLKDKGYINIEMIYKENSKEVEMRKIIPIEEKFKDNKIYNKNNNKIYNKDKRNFKKTKPDFEERKYEGFDFNTLYANYNMMKGIS